MSTALPSFALYKYYYDMINVDADRASTIAGLKRRVANACAVRLSYAFNQIQGYQIPKRPPGVAGNVWSGQGGYYILGSLGMARYMEKTYGKPVPRKPAAFQAEFADRVGILFYDVRIWTDANGHVALWNRGTGYWGAYFDEAREVRFWEMHEDHVTV